MKRVLLLTFALIGLLVTAFPAGLAQGASYFPETGHSVDNAFLGYWLEQGGLSQFGYPISDQMIENGRTVQYFQRAVFEYWPENPDPHKVQLGLLGSLLTEPRQREAPFGPVSPVDRSTNRWYFAQTQHTLAYGFLAYWQSHGGVAVFGFPISEEFLEVSPTDGNLYTVQYFQRNRFEYHGDKEGTSDVIQLGLLGAEYYRIKNAAPQEPTQPEPQQPNPNQPAPPEQPQPTPEPTPMPAPQPTQPAPQPTPSPSDPAPQPSGLRGYTSGPFHFRIGYPPNWTIEEQESAVTFWAPERLAALMATSASVPAGTTADQLAEVFISGMAQELPGYTIIDSAVFTFGGEAWLGVRTGCVSDGVVIGMDNFFTVHNGLGYAVVGMAPGIIFEDVVNGYFGPMMNSFEFTSGNSAITGLSTGLSSDPGAASITSRTAPQLVSTVKSVAESSPDSSFESSSIKGAIRGLMQDYQRLSAGR